MRPTSFLLGLALFGIFCLSAHGGSGAIVYASRPIRLSYAEPLPPKDFYVNLGARDGLKPGDHLQVQRNAGVPDSFSDSSVHVVPIILGDLQILVVGESACIAREVSSSPAPGTAIPLMPSLQYAGFMVGDEVLPKSGLPLGSAFP